MAKQITVPGPGQINMISEGTVMEGVYRAAGDVRVSGRVVGKLFVEGKVIVTQEGVIDGDLTAASADVAGTVIGEISVKDRLVLKSTAAVDGSLRSSRLVIEEGAVFGGKCHMGQNSPAVNGKAESEHVPDPKLAAPKASNGIRAEAVTHA